MNRLVVKPGSPDTWEIELKNGENHFGRGDANDFRIGDPSVSGSHCQIVVNDGTVAIRDLGSTNGTFVNGAPVQEATLQNAQTVRLGNVEMVFYADTPQPAVAPAGSRLKVAGIHQFPEEAAPATTGAPPPPIAPAPTLGGGSFGLQISSQKRGAMVLQPVQPVVLRFVRDFTPCG